LSVLLTLPLVIFLMRDRPRQQPWVSSEEIKLIEEAAVEKAKKEVSKTEAAVGGYLRDYRFWLLTLSWGVQGMYFYGWATWMPTYFRTVLHFSFQTAGYLYSLSYLFVAISIFV